jgi:membrane protein
MSTRLAWRPIIASTFRETLKDDAQGLAAQLSFHFFLSLFAMLLAMVAFASLFPLGNVTDQMTRVLAPIAPGQVLTIITDQMVAISQRPDTGLIAVGLVTALWSASSAMASVVDALNHARGVTESRPWWRVRVVSLMLTAGLALFALVAIALVLGGPQFADALTRWFGLGGLFDLIWKIAQWPVAFALAATGIGLIYHFGPDKAQRWRWFTPGSVAATILWLAGSLGFRAYVVHVKTYEGTYGTLGGVIVLLLWFYVFGLAIIVGAELDAEVERAKGESAARTPRHARV